MKPCWLNAPHLRPSCEQQFAGDGAEIGLAAGKVVPGADFPFEAKVFGDDVGEAEMKKVAGGGPNRREMAGAAAGGDLIAKMAEDALVACLARRFEQDCTSADAALGVIVIEFFGEFVIGEHQRLQIAIVRGGPGIFERGSERVAEQTLSEAAPAAAIHAEVLRAGAHAAEQPAHPFQTAGPFLDDGLLVPIFAGRRQESEGGERLGLQIARTLRKVRG